MDRIPLISELKEGDELIIDFGQGNCLAGYRRWILEFNGSEPLRPRLRTVGKRVISEEEQVSLGSNQAAGLDELLINLPSFPPGGSTEDCDFVVSFCSGGGSATTWEAKGVFPCKVSDNEPSHSDMVPYLILVRMCRQFHHHYRKPTLREKIASLPSTIGLALLFGVASLVVVPYHAVRWLFSRSPKD